jgi:hypothetical protein
MRCISCTADLRSRPRISTYTQPDNRAFSLRSIGGPSVTRTSATSDNTRRCPRSVTIASRLSLSTESRVSRG